MLNDKNQNKNNDSQTVQAVDSGFRVSGRMSRRESLKCLGLLVTAGLAATNSALAFAFEQTHAQNTHAGHWPKLHLSPVNAKGYGKDPNLIIPPSNPWPLIMTESEQGLCSVLCDIIVPQEGDIPSAAELDVQAVINEWISAPYAWQQSDRHIIMHLFAWLDDEAKLRTESQHDKGEATGFTDLSRDEQIKIIDDIAYLNENTSEAFIRPSQAFARLRELVLAAFFTTPTGMKDIGYMGNVPIQGDYPGPTEEAYAHLDTVLNKLGLSDFSYRSK
uniref:gluconate 2-dehydrogenase subunit 3 family protein n=1 Tax=Ningiella ruwaisensis TaxID=2364274 RepID=UPI0010A0202C|nr:gluconate 2-dehydrogenase subunit 3 family protein [Ningiella ruwaisensis]